MADKGKFRRTPAGTRKSPPRVKESDKNLSFYQDRIYDYLKQVRFKRSFLGGVDEADVWKKIGELNEMYDQALAAERLRYDALLAERVPLAARELAKHLVPDPNSEKAGDESNY